MRKVWRNEEKQRKAKKSKEKQRSVKKHEEAAKNSACQEFCGWHSFKNLPCMWMRLCVCVFSSKFTCFHDLPGLPKVASSFVAGQSVQCVQSSHTHPEVSASASRKPPLPGGDQDMLQGTGLVCST